MGRLDCLNCLGVEPSFTLIDPRVLNLIKPLSITSNTLMLHYDSLVLERDVENVPSQTLISGTKILFAFFLAFNASISFAKTSALFFYSRAFTTLDPKFRWALWTTHGIVLAWFIALMISSVFFCTPVHKYWELLAPGHCQSRFVMNLGSAVASSIIDAIILVLPVPVVWRLQIELGQKFLVFFALLCGYGYSMDPISVYL